MMDYDCLNEITRDALAGSEDEAVQADRTDLDCLRRPSERREEQVFTPSQKPVVVLEAGNCVTHQLTAGHRVGPVVLLWPHATAVARLSTEGTPERSEASRRAAAVSTTGVPGASKTWVLTEPTPLWAFPGSTVCGGIRLLRDQDQYGQAIKGLDKMSKYQSHDCDRHVPGPAVAAGGLARWCPPGNAGWRVGTLTAWLKGGLRDNKMRTMRSSE